MDFTLDSRTLLKLKYQFLPLPLIVRVFPMTKAMQSAYPIASFIATAFILLSCSQKPADNNAVSGGRVIALYDGYSLRGWYADVPALDTDSAARSPFIIRDSLLVSLGTPEGHLITNESYSNYILDVEYRFAAAPGNCGVLVHASTPRALYKMFPKSIEVQMMHENAGDFWCIVEDITVPDMEKRRGPRENWGITEGRERRVLNLTDGSEKPLGEWNAMRITCFGDSIQVVVNGDLVNFGYDCTARKGQIALQAEGSEVEFRKVVLTPIKVWEGLPE